MSDKQLRRRAKATTLPCTVLIVIVCLNTVAGNAAAADIHPTHPRIFFTSDDIPAVQ